VHWFLVFCGFYFKKRGKNDGSASRDFGFAFKIARFIFA
jgi:hypothetical protein